MRLTAVLLAASLARPGLVTVDRVSGRDEGPGTSLGALGWFVGVWVTMTAAMMLPSATPAIALFARSAS